jgi:hypothetical protein
MSENFLPGRSGFDRRALTAHKFVGHRIRTPTVCPWRVLEAINCGVPVLGCDSPGVAPLL